MADEKKAPNGQFKVKIVWKGEIDERTPSPKDTAAKVLEDYIREKALKFIDELPYFHLTNLTNDNLPVDLAQSLERNGITNGDVLLLSKLQPHHQTRWDVVVASILVVYTLILFGTALLALMSVWPSTADQLALNSTRSLNITIPLIGGFLGTASYSVGPELLLFSAMILAGMLGACVYSLYAISLHLGSYEDFNWTWTVWYVGRPWLGGGIAIALYLLVRSGLFTLNTNVNTLNLLGLAGISMLVGLFTEQVLHKLNDLVDTLFGPGPANTPGSKPGVEKGSDKSGKRTS